MHDLVQVQQPARYYNASDSYAAAAAVAFYLLYDALFYGTMHIIRDSALMSQTRFCPLSSLATLNYFDSCLDPRE